MKKSTKRKIPITLLLLEVFIFSFYYCFGAQGLWNLKKARHEILMLETETCAIAQEVYNLEQKIEQWNSYPFYKEKIAREQLQMAHEEESIYYIS